MNDINITSAQYLEMDGVNTAIRIIVDGKVTDVGLDPASRYYQAIQDWVAEGNTIADAD